MPRFIALILCVMPLWAGDPRPTVVVIGENGTVPFGGAPGWPQLIASRRPAWRVMPDADPKRDLDAAITAAPAILAKAGHADLVAVLIGTTDAAADHAAGAATFAARYRSLLQTIKAHPAASRAAIVAITPVPVVAARLDKWSTERFAGGEERSAALAAAVREAAKAEGATVIDLHRIAWEDAENGKPGRVVGSIGWLPRDWGHPILAGWLEPALAAALPAPADPAALAAWQAEADAELALDRILAETGGGTPDLGPPLVVSMDKGNTSIAIPAERIAAARGRLAVALLAPTGAANAMIIGEGKPRPSLAIGAWKVEPPSWSWACIDEAAPAALVDRNRFRLNQGKMRYFASARDGDGVRRIVLLSIPLDGAPAGDGVLSIACAGTLDNADAALQLGLRAHVLVGRDAGFDPLTATWNARDGFGAPWTGGVATPARAERLRQFLSGSPPAGAAARARTLLGGG
jgi:hypothetical protein